MRAFTLGAVSLAVFLGSFALVFGLTYLPCWSAICVEKHFPYNVRIHLISFYVSCSAYFLFFIARARIPALKNATSRLVSSRPIPFTSTYVSWGGLAVSIGVLGFAGATQGYFWEDELAFYRHRVLNAAGTTLGSTRLAIVGSAGHICDMLLGAVIIPVGRDGVLVRGLGFEVGTLLRFHKLVAWLFFLVMWIHMIPFYAWVPVFARAEGPLKLVFGIDNPTMSQTEVEENYYYATVLATGMISLGIFVAIIITSLPKFRRMSYNTFYYTHMLVILFFILLCLHASTDFYLLLPGLCLWLMDWVYRLRGLRTKVTAKLQREENGWFRLEVDTRDLPEATIRHLEQTAEWPLKHFYLNVPQVSRWQNHALTTLTGLSTSVTETTPHIVWLFRVSNLGKAQKQQSREWTVRLASLLDTTLSTPSSPLPARHDLSSAELAISSSALPPTSSHPTSLHLPTLSLPIRIEGPYITPHAPLSTYKSILCIVGGTGITGALSLASSFSIRASDYAELSDVRALLSRAAARGVGLRVVVYKTAGSGAARLDLAEKVREFTTSGIVRDEGLTAAEKTHGEESAQRFESGWVYFSGPTGLMDAGEKACMMVAREEGLRRERFGWYCAKWEV